MLDCFGIRGKISCEIQLIEFVQQLHESFELGQRIDAVSMDFSKAFDKVAHNRLLLKLERSGVTGTTNQWIGNFLAGRTQSGCRRGCIQLCPTYIGSPTRISLRACVVSSIY